MTQPAERQVEALLFAAAGPLSLEDLAKRLPAGADVEAALAALQAHEAAELAAKAAKS